MKKIIPILYTLYLILYTLALPVQAESAQNVTKRRPDKPAQAEIQEIRQENRRKVAENHANRLERRFKFYFDRMTSIIARFQARLDTLQTAGKDVSAIQAKLDSTKVKLSEAKTKGESAVVAFRATDPAGRDFAESTRTLFKEAHTLLKDALKSLKAISKPALPAASPAVQNVQ